MTEKRAIITISDVLEYLFCPRFIYFMHCLEIPQHEEMRFKVLRGREVHEEKRSINPHYLRKKIGVVRREQNVFLASKEHCIKGIVDEVLFLDDGTAAPFEYKFAEFKEKVFRTYHNQLALHAMMIQEQFDVEVNRGFICFVRSRDHVEEVAFSEKDFERAREIVQEILEIIGTGYFPKRSRSRTHCIDCCYRNICV
jgi:CRISPR-associated exonuclease Cas4